MPLDLFGGPGTCSPTPSSKPRSIVAITVGLHAIVIGSALFLSLASPGLIPTPRLALAFVDPERRVVLADVALPTPKKPERISNPEAPAVTAPATPSNSSEPTPDAPNVPLVAPRGIAAERATEPTVSNGRASSLSNIESGGSGFDLARVERPSPPSVPTPVRMNSGIQAPIKLVNVDPAYPALAQGARVQGVVILEAIIDVSGRVEAVRVLKSIPLLDAAAEAAVKQWRYSAARLNGEPVPVIMTVTVNFKL